MFRVWGVWGFRFVSGVKGLGVRGFAGVRGLGFVLGAVRGIPGVWGLEPYGGHWRLVFGLWVWGLKVQGCRLLGFEAFRLRGL